MASNHHRRCPPKFFENFSENTGNGMKIGGEFPPFLVIAKHFVIWQSVVANKHCAGGRLTRLGSCNIKINSSEVIHV